MTLQQSLKAAAIAGQISSQPELNQFLAQCEEESGNFTGKSENLHYSAARLKVVWPARFARMSDTQLAPYVMNPENLANSVYANRMGNGNMQSKDGWTFRGRGYLQLTGKSMYSTIGHLIGVDLIGNPDLLNTQNVNELATIAYWKAEVRPVVMHRGVKYDNTSEITDIVNGGQTNVATRIAIFNRLQSA